MCRTEAWETLRFGEGEMFAISENTAQVIWFVCFHRSNYHCLTCLLFNVGNKTLRQFFKSNWSGKLYSAAGFTGTAWSDLPADGHQLLAVDRGLRLDKNERKKVQSGDTLRWDFTILTKILMHSSLGFVVPASDEYTMLDTLRQTRNTLIGHASEASIPEGVFTSTWADTTSILKHFGASQVEIISVKLGR